MAGVLLHHVQHHLAQRDGRAVLHGAAAGEVGRAGHEPLREGDLLAPGAPGVGPRGWSAGPVRHGVSALRSGRRFTL